MIRDVAVKVPEPEDFIAEAVFPSHIVVPRCSGQFNSLHFVEQHCVSRCLRQLCRLDLSP